MRFISSLVSSIKSNVAPSLLIASVIFVIAVKLLALVIGQNWAFWIMIVLLVAFTLWLTWRFVGSELLAVVIATIATLILAFELTSMTEQTITYGNLVPAVICVVFILAIGRRLQKIFIL